MGNLHLLQKGETVTEDDASNESLRYLHNPKLPFIQSSNYCINLDFSSPTISIFEKGGVYRTHG